ncbi:MAG: 30S ribosomal protein S2 [Microgenomates group bacterium GW2011_GWB1_40_9]|nr:MAG: 30S ribosomal protein S2 [Microgenomates group bacterium GW2011_GWB1_40_9]
MKDITLQDLLEAGCHFGHKSERWHPHKSERWHPKAQQFIYTEKDGIHIIDLAKTKIGLDAAVAFVKELVAGGSELLFVATKRQAKGIVKEEAIRVGAPYMTERWIGGFLTNWDGIHKNIQKIIRLTDEEATGAWKKFPKHEQMKLSRYLARLKVFYGGVLQLNVPPQAMFIVDVKKEIAAVREGLRCGIPIIAIVDTNSDPTGITHVIPANDDAVGSITIVAKTIAAAYEEGRATRAKMAEDMEKEKAKELAKKEPAKKGDVIDEIKKEEKRLSEAKSREASREVGKRAKKTKTE